MADDFDFDHFFDDLKTSLDDDSPFVEVEPRQQAPEPPQEPRKAPARETAPRKRETPPAAPKQPKKKASAVKSIIYIVLIIICLVVIVKSCGGGNDKATPAVDPTQAPVAEEVTETAAPQADQAPQAVLSADACDTIVKSVISSTWGDNYEFERSDNSVIIKVWNDGVTAEAAAAMQGDEAVLDDWNGAMDNMLYFTNQVQEAYNQNGNGDTLVAVFLLNDTNKDNVLAVTSLGMVMYDAINGIDLMGVEE